MTGFSTRASDADARASLAWARQGAEARPSASLLARRVALQAAGLALRRRPLVQPHPSQQVLVLQPDHLGDVLLASPALQELALARPALPITYLVGPWSEEVAQHGPLGRSVETLAYPGFTRAPATGRLAPYQLLLRQAAVLRQRRYALALILRPDHWWGALLALAAGIPRRVGYALPDTAPFLTHALELRAAPASERAAALVHQALSLLRPPAPGRQPRGLIFHVTEQESQAAAQLLAGELANGQPLVAVHPTAGAALKSWPLEAWAELARGLAGQGVQVVLTGAAEDAPVVQQIRARAGSQPLLAVGLPLGVLASLLARCRLVVGLDSGPLHLASAVGTPTVRLYGPASPFLYGPWPPSPQQVVLLTSRLACVPCGQLVQPPCGFSSYPPCLRALSVAQVLERARRLIVT